MDPKYVEMRRAFVLATIKARDLIRATDEQIKKAGCLSENGRPPVHEFGVRLDWPVHPMLETKIRQWIGEVEHAVRIGWDDPSDAALSNLKLALSQLEAGVREMTYYDALTSIVGPRLVSVHWENGCSRH